eukprot:8901727-Pyramimonas_sp.AAC.1
MYSGIALSAFWSRPLARSLACKLFRNGTLALEFPAIYSSTALPTIRHPGAALTLRTPSQMT